ncbi:MAG TPA: 30S ribosomal protein S7 [Candidatus Kaiserbacteria bacterium]|nr:30S ribosomal protein S7 [Candidatus Kaiserbacteria bacterium]
MRHPIKKPRTWKPDLKYQSETLTRFINAVMLDGKKDIARKVVYEALSNLSVENEEGKKLEAIEVFETAIRNVSPLMEVRSRRVGGANYQVPREVPQQRRLALAFRWIINGARNKKGRPMAEKLAEELTLAAKNEGDAVKKKEDMHRMAESNKAFAHFAW